MAKNRDIVSEPITQELNKILNEDEIQSHFSSNSTQNNSFSE